MFVDPFRSIRASTIEKDLLLERARDLHHGQLQQVHSRVPRMVYLPGIVRGLPGGRAVARDNVIVYIDSKAFPWLPELDDRVLRFQYNHKTNLFELQIPDDIPYAETVPAKLTGYTVGHGCLIAPPAMVRQLIRGFKPGQSVQLQRFNLHQDLPSRHPVLVNGTVRAVTDNGIRVFVDAFEVEMTFGRYDPLKTHECLIPSLNGFSPMPKVKPRRSSSKKSKSGTSTYFRPGPTPQFEYRLSAFPSWREQLVPMMVAFKRLTVKEREKAAATGTTPPLTDVDPRLYQMIANLL